MSLIVVIAETADNLSGQTRMHNLRKKRTNLLHSPPIHSTDYNCNIRRMQLQTENNLLHSLPLNRLHRSPTTRMVLSVRPTLTVSCLTCFTCLSVPSLMCLTYFTRSLVRWMVGVGHTTWLLKPVLLIFLIFPQLFVDFLNSCDCRDCWQVEWSDANAQFEEKRTNFVHPLHRTDSTTS